MNAFARAQAAYASDGLSTTPTSKLLILLLQRAMRDLDDAKRAIAAGEIEAAHRALVHAQDIIHELRLALDPDGFEGGHGLADVYGYLADRLIAANASKRAELVAECQVLLEPIASAFVEVSAAVREPAGLGSTA